MSTTSQGANPRTIELPVPATAAPDDRGLARGAARGDQRAFDTIFRRYHRDLYRYCRAILGDAQEAEDALQSTMLKALRALPGDGRDIALRPWLFRVAHNEAIGIVRARHAPVELDADQVDIRGSVDERAQTRERLRRLVTDLSELPERQRGALVMRELSGLSFAEIGASLEISEAAAKQIVYEARTSLHLMAEGRDMDCDPVREAISASDRRRLRNRRIRAHLRSCRSCRSFEESIAERRADLAVLAPPIAVPAVLAAIKGSIGGGATATGASGVAATGGGAVGAAAVAKSVASVLAVVAIAGGAAEVSRIADFDGSEGGRDGPATSERAPTSPGQPSGGDHATRDILPAAIQPGRNPDHARSNSGGRESRNAHENGRAAHESSPSHPPASARASSTAASQSATPPGQTQTPPGQSSTPPGQSQTPPGQAQTPPGQDQASESSTPPGQTAAPPGQAQTPPGQAQTPPGQAQTPPGQAQTPPGQAQTPPGQVTEDAVVESSPGNSAAAPGHTK